MPTHPGSQPSPGRVGDHAIVLGASMAGLLAARVLADAYAQVTIIDRDQLPPAGTHRRGLPHGRHLHALLARGQQALEELFPGLTDELVAQGVPAGDVLGNGRCYLNGHRLRQTHTGLVALCASRPFLEGHVRGRVGRCPTWGSWTPATSSCWPPRPAVAASPGRGCAAGPTAAPRRRSTPTWW
jgi:hypothetical protein